MEDFKKCLSCEEVLSTENFYIRTDKRSNPHRKVLVASCKKCHQKQNKTYWTEDKKRLYNNKKKKERRERKKRAIEYKGSTCNHCKNIFHIAAFDFHHINPDEKNTDPGLMMQLPDEILFKELDKCILLCANCHRIHHYEEGTLGEIKARKRKS